MFAGAWYESPSRGILPLPTSSDKNELCFYLRGEVPTNRNQKLKKIPGPNGIYFCLLKEYA
uniref:Uncharacterized protein n=1 Tax=Anguilla anguilla TaxID=7936 RepID=A0A0E9SB98_ANGAN